MLNTINNSPKTARDTTQLIKMIKTDLTWIAISTTVALSASTIAYMLLTKPAS